jgi:hypothetical chaperone protein
MGLRVGIDFGTSNSGVGVSDGRQVRLLPIDSTSILPEVVKTVLYVTKDFHYSIGQEAVELYYKHNVNRLRRYEKKWVGEIEYRGADMYYVRDVYSYVDVLKPGRLLQYIKSGLRSEKYEGTLIFDRYFSLVEIISIYLRELKNRAESLLHEEITGAVIGRPVSFFSDPVLDRRSENTLREAAYGAGFEQVDFELEPVAAAHFYEQSLEKPQTVLVFDFGGGTLDITIIRLGDAEDRTVYASGGIGAAGSDFDRAIIEKRMLYHFGKGRIDGNPEIRELVDAIPDWMVLPELSTPQVKYSLQQAALYGRAPSRVKALQSLIFNDLSFSFYNTVESAKISLSTQGTTIIQLEARDMDVWELYTRHQFEQDILEYRDQIEKVLLETVAVSGFAPDQIDSVVKTGGSSNIPLFSGLLERIFGADRVVSPNLFSSVTAGLAIQAHKGRSS